MKWIAAAIALLAVAVLIVGWRATTHHHRCHPTAYDSCFRLGH